MLEDIDHSKFEETRRRVVEVDAKSSCRRGDLWSANDSGLPKIEALSEPKIKERTKKNDGERSFYEGTEAVGALLSGLKSEVATHRLEEKLHLLKTGNSRSEICSRLMAVFSYFRELTESLNALRVKTNSAYFLLNTGHQLEDLSWHEGWTDFRSLGEQDGGGVKLVTLGFELHGEGDFTFERYGTESVEKFHSTLFDLSMRFQRSDQKNKGGFIERSVFKVQNKVVAKSLWRGDFDNNRVLVDMGNIDRLGIKTAVVKPGNIGPDALNEFGMMILGKSNRFKDFVDGYI